MLPAEFEHNVPRRVRVDKFTKAKVKKYWNNLKR